MACIIQLNGFLREKRANPSYSSSKHPFNRQNQSMKSRLQSLFNNFYNPFIRYTQQLQPNYLINFVVPFIQSSELFFQIQLSKNLQLRKAKFKLMKEGRFAYPCFNQSIRNLCKLITSMNLTKATSRFTFGIDLKNGEIGGKAAFKGFTLNNQKLLALTQSLVQQSQNFIKDYVGVFLYNCNSYGYKFLQQHGSKYAKQLVFGREGQVKTFTKIKELLPFLNIDISGRESSKKEQSSLQNSQDMLKNFYKQHKKMSQQHILYAFYNYYDINQSINKRITPEIFAKELNFHFSPQAQQNIKKISIIAHQKQRQRVLKQGPKAKVSVIYFKFKMLGNGTQVQLESKPRQQMLVLKQGVKKNDLSKGMIIRYQKEIIQHLGSSYCPYIPIYYQVSQPNSPFNQQILMQFISGYSIHQVVEMKKYFLGITSKLKLLLHLSNALRYLDKQKVVHIDLSPNNIMVVEDLFVKLIDFGQAYCQKVSAKYAGSQKMGKSDTNFKYRPCKTFPFSSPEAYCRSSNFTSQQDIYSFGIIGLKILFGFNIMTCNQKTLEKLYKTKEYVNRVFFVPQLTSEYVNNDVLCILTQILFKMLQVDQKSRPLISWTYIIIQRLFNMISR